MKKARFVKTTTYADLPLNELISDNKSLVLFATNNLFGELKMGSNNHSVANFISTIKNKVRTDKNVLDLYEEKFILKTIIESTVNDEALRLGYKNSINDIFKHFCDLQYQNIDPKQIANKDNLLKLYQAYMEALSQEEKKGFIAAVKEQIVEELKKVNQLALVGFIYLNAEQVFILNSAKQLDIEIAIISNEKYVFDKLFAPMLGNGQETKIEAQRGKFSSISDAIFTDAKIDTTISKDLQVYKAFNNKDEELNFVADSIIDLLKEDAANLDKIAIVVAQDKSGYENYLDDIFKAKNFVLGKKRVGVKCHKTIKDTKFGSFMYSLLGVVNDYNYEDIKNALLYLNNQGISQVCKMLDVYLKSAKSILELTKKIETIKEYKSEIADQFEYKFHPITKVSDEQYSLFIKALNFINGFANIISGNNTLQNYYKQVKSSFTSIKEEQLFETEELKILETIVSMLDNLKNANNKNVDYSYFVEIMKEILNQSYEEINEQKACISVVNKENISKYDYVFVISFDNEKYPFPKETNTFYSQLLELKNQVQVYVPVEYENNYYLTLDQRLFKNIFEMANSKIYFTYSKTDNGKAKNISYYYKDMIAIMPEIKQINGSSSRIRKDLMRDAHYLEEIVEIKEVRLTTLLKYYLCPKSFYYDQLYYEKLYYGDDFTLNYYYRAVVFYKIFKQLGTTGKVYDLESFNREILGLLAEIKKKEIKYFDFLTFNQTKDIEKFIMAQVNGFVTNSFLKKKTRDCKFKIEFIKPYKLLVDGVKVIVEPRIAIINKKTNETNEFDIAKNLELLVGKTNNNRCELKHYDEIVERLNACSSYDDRLEMLQTMIFKVNTQLSTRFKEDGIKRISSAIYQVKNTNFWQAIPIKSDFCKYCKCKDFCKGDLL